MNDVYIVGAARTAVGNLLGALAEIHPAKLAEPLIRDLIRRAGIEAAAVDEVILGNVLSAGLGQNVARQAAMAAGIPKERPAMSVNMVCGSGLRSVGLAAQAARGGDAEILIAGGTENMSLAPYMLPKARAGIRMGHGEVLDSAVRDGLWDVFNDYHMGVAAENLAERFGISRQDQDEFAAGSQARAESAIKAGRFAEEIVSVGVPQRKGPPVDFKTDEFPRFGTTAEVLAKLKPAFKKDGTVTAGNSSGINDGAACLMIAGEEAVREHKLTPLARIVSGGVVGTDPALMGIGPVEAVKKALTVAGWKLSDVDLIEANEAFAAQALALTRSLEWDLERVNVNGGAIALGHPIGASGARILVTLLCEMRRRNAKKGLATLCIGGGMGIAMCVER
ncbi:MAG: acetyl-CoA C-acetyltransferase [Verrucomicrobiota bacterium]|nr:acetyl-CoA C-acetyltransferase [Verrucomicrobiota bacterium]